MPEEFAEVLDRLDITFADFDTMSGLIERLDHLLGSRATALQIDITVDRLLGERVFAEEEGLRVIRVPRIPQVGQLSQTVQALQGGTVAQLRNRFGQIVTTGGRRIHDYFQSEFRR